VADTKDRADSFLEKEVKDDKHITKTNRHNRHICHGQAWAQLVTVFVTVPAATKNRHSIFKAICDGVTVVKVLAGYFK
jgi:hypothetical protein